MKQLELFTTEKDSFIRHRYSEAEDAYCSVQGFHLLDKNNCCSNEGCDKSEFYACDDCQELVYADKVEWRGADNDLKKLCNWCNSNY